MESSRSQSVADIAIRERDLIAPAAGSRARVLDRLRLGDAAFRQVTRAAAIGVLVLLSAVIISLIRGSIPALKTFGFGFLVSERWNPVTENLRRLAGDLRHRDYVFHRHAIRGADRPDDRVLPDRALPEMAAPADRHRDRTARGNSEHHLRHLGIVRIRPIPAGDAAAFPDRHFGQCAADRAVVRRAALRHRHADRGADPRDHGAAVHHLDIARRVRGRPRRSQGSGLRSWLHHLGSRCATSCCPMPGSA